MLNYQQTKFSKNISQRRIDLAVKVFGNKIVERIIFFALYLLGANINLLAKQLNTPIQTMKSFIDRIFKDGLSALEDRRKKSSSFLPIEEKKPLKTFCSRDDKNIIITFDNVEQKINIPIKNSVQCKTVLLTLCENKLLSGSEVSKVLNFSPGHISRLNKKLHNEDVLSLIDKRIGQQQDYRFTPQLKGEIIQQFVIDLVTMGRTSGRLISEHIRERCDIDIDLSSRSIRYHIAKLGLNLIKITLLSLLREEKKTFGDNRRI